MHAVVSEFAACMSGDQTTISLFHVAAFIQLNAFLHELRASGRDFAHPPPPPPPFWSWVSGPLGGGSVGTGKWLFSLILSHLWFDFTSWGSDLFNLNGFFYL